MVNLLLLFRFFFFIIAHNMYKCSLMLQAQNAQEIKVDFLKKNKYLI